LNGAPVEGAVVVATEWDASASAEVVVARTTTGPDGHYLFSGLRENNDSYLYAWDPDLLRNASGVVSVGTGPQPAVAETITLATDASIGSVLVRAAVESTGEPASNHVATVELEGWPFLVDVTLDGLGEARVAGLPGGYRVVATVAGPQGFGREAVDLTSQAETLLTVPVGGRVPLPALLSPFAFSGDLLYETPNSCTPFCVSPGIESGQAIGSFDRAYSAGVDATRRDLTVVFRLPVQGDPGSHLRLTRRLYVPAGGEFARIVDVVENAGSAAVDMRYYLDQYLQPSGGILTEILDGVVTPDDAAFVFQSDQLATDTTGFVIRGPGGLLPTDLFANADNWGAFSQWNLALEPGQKVALMSFVVFGRGAGAATVVSRVQALMNLTDPLALQGLSPEDRALILNWILP
jgi:hypothetical protein